jgi:hypothetical protein
LTPLADLGRSAGQAPLHGVRPAGIGAGGDDAEIGARLFQRLRIDVGLGGRLLDVGHLLRATRKLVLEELLRPPAAFTATGPPPPLGQKTKAPPKRGQGLILERKSR